MIEEVSREKHKAESVNSVIPNTLRVIPTTIVTFLVYENTKIYLPKLFQDDEQSSHEED